MIEWFIFIACLGLSVYAGFRYLGHRRSTTPAPPFEPTDTGSGQTGLVTQFMLRMGLRIDPRLFLGCVTVTGLAILLLFVELFPDNFALAATATAGAGGILFLALADLNAMRSRNFEAKLIESLDLMNAALLGGLPPRQALLVAADTSKGKVKAELLEIVNRLDLGLSVEASVRRMNHRYDGEGVRLFTQALIAKWHSGSDFCALLQAVSELIRDRIKLRLLVSGQLSSARYAAIFSGVLPYLLVPLFLWRQPQWFETLLAHPQGLTFLTGAALMQVFGFFWLRQILRVKL